MLQCIASLFDTGGPIWILECGNLSHDASYLKNLLRFSKANITDALVTVSRDDMTLVLTVVKQLLYKS